MLKRITGYLGTILTFLILGIVHVSPALATTIPAHSEQGDHGSASCQVACQARPQKPQDKLSTEADEDDDEKGAVLAFNETKLVDSGVGLLRENAIWKQSCWVPPDLLLQSGAYSTSL